MKRLRSRWQSVSDTCRLPVVRWRSLLNNNVQPPERGRDRATTAEVETGQPVMATGWFQRATAVFGRPEPLPQPFDVGCDCGARLQGFRASMPQKTNCPTCGTVTFILPETPYPLPDSLKRRWTGEGDAEPEPASLKKSKKPKSVKKKELGDIPKHPAPAVDPGPTLGDRLRTWGSQLRSAATPVRMVGLAIVVGFALTTVVIYRKAQWDRALTTLQGALDRGAEAVQKQDFAAASEEFQTAAAALDVLGRKDADALLIRHAARETTAAAGLSRLPWSEVVTAWGEAKEGVAALESARENWILFDAPLFPLSDAEEGSRGEYRVDLPLMVDQTPVDLVIDGRKWSALLSGATAATPKRVIFAAQIERGEKPSKARPEALLHLDGVTAVLWSDAALYTQLGLMPDEASSREGVELVLKGQSEFLETHP